MKVLTADVQRNAKRTRCHSGAPTLDRLSCITCSEGDALAHLPHATFTLKPVNHNIRQGE